MNSWLFQGNPDQFRMDEYLAVNREMTWAIRQAKVAPQIAEGDEVFIWRAAGAGKAEAGVVALARVTRGAVVEPEDATSLRYWSTAAPAEPRWRVRLRVEKLCLGAKEVVKRGWMADDPILRDLNVIRQSHATNYAVTTAQAQRLANLVRNTGRTWDHDECLDQSHRQWHSAPLRPARPVRRRATADLPRHPDRALR
jgi:predicted RNA-binding protein with PUA-like domain